jgi:hypothetical protein
MCRGLLSLSFVFVTLLFVSTVQAGPGLYGRIAADEETRFTYTADEYYRPAPDWVRESVLADGVDPDFVIIQEGSAVSSRTFVRSADGTRFSRRLTTYNGRPIEEDSSLKFHPYLEVVAWQDDGESRALKSHMGGTELPATLSYGRTFELGERAPDDLRYDFILGLRGYGMSDWNTIDPEGFVVRETQEGRVFDYEHKGRLHRWTCDPARDDLVLRYEVWQKNGDRDARPTWLMETLEVAQRVAPDGTPVWYPKVAEFKAFGDFWKDDKPGKTARIEVVDFEFVTLSDENPTAVKLDMPPEVPTLITDKDGKMTSNMPACEL